MRLYTRWAVPLAVLGGVALGAALTSRRRNQHLATQRQHKNQVHSWEGEGGNVATPTPDAALGSSMPL